MFWGDHEFGDSGLVDCNAVSVSEWFPMFL